jgi:hypothetical protein
MRPTSPSFVVRDFASASSGRRATSPIWAAATAANSWSMGGLLSAMAPASSARPRQACSVAVQA